MRTMGTADDNDQEATQNEQQKKYTWMSSHTDDRLTRASHQEKAQKHKVVRVHPLLRSWL